MTILTRIYDYIFHIVVAVIIFIAGFLIIGLALPKPQFSYTEYEQQHVAFMQCIDDPNILEEARGLVHTYQDIDVVTLKQRYDALRFGHACASHFVVSSYEQVQKMAMEVLVAAQNYYGTTDVKLLDTVYTMDEKFAVLLEHPQSYLFLATNEDVSSMAAMIAYPLRDGYRITPVWPVEQGENTEEIQQQLQHLMILYNEIKK